MILPVLISIATLLPAPPAVAELTAKERDFAITHLQETRQKFLASIEGLTAGSVDVQGGSGPVVHRRNRGAYRRQRIDASGVGDHEDHECPGADW